MYDVYTPPKRTVTVEDIDAATTPEERIALTRTCLDEENRARAACLGGYWAVYQIVRPIHEPLLNPYENLVWEIMHPSNPRPPLYYRLYHIDNHYGFNGYIDITAHCISIAQHNPKDDETHKCINRTPDCFNIKLQILSHEAHPTTDNKYPRDLDIIQYHDSDSLEMVYSFSIRSGRLITCKSFYYYVPSYLAATDGFIPRSVLEQIAQSPVNISDISALLA